VSRPERARVSADEPSADGIAGGGSAGVAARGSAAVATWGPVYALALVFVITVAWWALALWPSAGAAPAWLERARAVCFNFTDSGLPDASGWLLLVGQPLGMVGLLAVGWGGGLKRGMRRVAGSGPGRIALGMVALVIVGGLGATGVRVSTARAAVAPPVLPAVGGDVGAAGIPRLDHTAPPARLVDQHGDRVGVPDFAGRPLLVTFAFGNCATICPVVVHQARLAVERLAAGGTEAGLLVVTLDPWRDTPARLGAMADRWELPGLPGAGAHVASGTVAEVQAVLDGWKVARERDPRTGDIVHPALTYVVDEGGVVRYATTGRAGDLVELVERLER